MNTLYQNTTVFIAGDHTILYKEILSVLLQQKMKVIVAMPYNTSKHQATITAGLEQPGEDHCLEYILKQQLIIHETDLSNEQQLEQLVKSVCNEHGPIDLALYLSDQTRQSPSLLEMPAAQWTNMLKEDLSAYLYTAKTVLKQMTEANGGLYLHLVNQENFLNEQGYALANIAAVAQMETAGILAQEVAPYRVSYHHISLQNLLLNATAGNSKTEHTVAPMEVAHYILDLYTDYHTSKAETFKVFGKLANNLHTLQSHP